MFPLPAQHTKLYASASSGSARVYCPFFLAVVRRPVLLPASPASARRRNADGVTVSPPRGNPVLDTRVRTVYATAHTMSS